MLNRIKAFLLRLGYRFLSRRAWRKDRIDLPYSTLQMATEGGPLALRMYNGEGAVDKPLIMFLHGGGWVIGDLDTHHPLCQMLCIETRCTVISVDYRLAPEHPYPAAQADSLAAAQWIAAHLGELGPNNGKFILAGDSAGGHLATCTCLALGENEHQLLTGEILIYPVTDHYSNAYPSYQEKARGYALSSNLMRWFWDTYLHHKIELAKHPVDASPMHAPNMDVLPSTLLITAEHDPLRDEGVAYGEKLRAAGVEVVHIHYENEEHGFAASAGASPALKQLMKEIKHWVAGLA